MHSGLSLAAPGAIAAAPYLRCLASICHSTSEPRTLPFSVSARQPCRRFWYPQIMKQFSFLKLISILSLAGLFLFAASEANAQAWTAKLDKSVRFYQATDLGVLLVGTEKSLYAVDGSNGETLWRRKDVSLDETDVAPVPGLRSGLAQF